MAGATESSNQRGGPASRRATGAYRYSAQSARPGQLREPGEPGENRLLAALPRAEYRQLQPHLERVRLDQQEVLYRPNEPVPYVYFPISGVVSLVITMDDGATAEVGIVGNEGMLGLSAFLGTESFPCQALCQYPGEAWRMPAAAFRVAVVTKTPEGQLYALLQRYAHALLIQIAQMAACSRLHSADERLVRWLLMTHDRTGADQFPLTHRFIGKMLGVRRATVTGTMGVLQQAGLVRYRRGTATILDRQRLETAACECYWAIGVEFDRVLGAAALNKSMSRRQASRSR